MAGYKGMYSGYNEFRHGPKPTGRATPRLAGQGKRETRVVQPIGVTRHARRRDDHHYPRLVDPIRLHQPAFKEKEIPQIVAIVADLLRDGGTSPWGNEVAVFEGLRARILEKNWCFEEAEAEALDIIRRAFNSLGRGIETRPKFEEGQRQATQTRDQCKRCCGPLDDGDIAAGAYFCSPECSAAAKVDSHAYWLVLAKKTTDRAKDLRAREKLEQKLCECCNEPFMPTSEEGRYCTQKCNMVHRAILNGTRRKKRPCLHCGEGFIPNHKDSKYCCNEHRRAALESTTRICAWDGAAFHPKTLTARYCCESCAHEAAKAKRRKGYVSG